MALHLNYWTPIKYGDQAAHCGHRLLEFADRYFNHKPIVAVVVPGIMQKNSTGVKLQEKIQPLWQTILKIISYATMIIPVILLCVKRILRTMYPFHICSRTLPNGIEETGAFVNGVLQQGVRIEQGQTVYVKPKLLLKDEFEFNFAEVMIDGKPAVIPVQNKNETDEFTACQESATSCILKIIDDDSEVLEHALNLPHQEQFVQEFFTFLLSPNEYGQIPILTIRFENKKSLLAILRQAEKHSVSIVSEILDELFVQTAGKGCAELTELILKQRPEAIDKLKSSISLAALNGSSKEIEILLKAITERNIELDPWDIWIYRAYANDCNFTEEEFENLPEELRNEIFEVANVFMRQEFLLKIRSLQLEEDIWPATQANIFSPNMDGIHVKNAIYDFLINLRHAGTLLTEKEFQLSGINRLKQNYSLSCLTALHYLERAAAHLRLNHIKFQKRSVVFTPKDQNKPTIDIVIGIWPGLSIRSDDLSIYLETITPIQRKATRAEILGLLDLLEHTGFQFIPDCPIIVMGKNADGEEGLYFDSPIYHNIKQHPDYASMHTLSKLMAEEDQAWLETEIKARKARFDKEDTGTDAEDEDELEDIASRHGFSILRTLQVPIGDLRRVVN